MLKKQKGIQRWQLPISDPKKMATFLGAPSSHSRTQAEKEKNFCKSPSSDFFQTMLCGSLSSTGELQCHCTSGDGRLH